MYCLMLCGFEEVTTIWKSLFLAIAIFQIIVRWGYVSTDYCFLWKELNPSFWEQLFKASRTCSLLWRRPTQNENFHIFIFSHFPFSSQLDPFNYDQQLSVFTVSGRICLNATLWFDGQKCALGHFKQQPTDLKVTIRFFCSTQKHLFQPLCTSSPTT